MPHELGFSGPGLSTEFALCNLPSCCVRGASNCEVLKGPPVIRQRLEEFGFGSSVEEGSRKALEALYANA